MKSILIKTSLFQFAIYLICAPLLELHAQQNNKTEYRIAHIGLSYPISTNGKDAAKFENGFSFHVLVGVSGAERSFALGGLGNIVKKDTRGLLLSGLFNQVGGDARGLHLAGLTNLIQGQGTGLQVAGLYNQAASFDGMQLAGIMNHSGANANMQTAGLINRGKNMSGLQLSGLLNTAESSSAQIAGLINISKKAKGVQLAGLINIAEESDYPIAPVNIIKNGEQQIGLSLDADGNSMLNFRSGGRMTYGLVGIGYNLGQNIAPFVLEAGIGLHIPLVRSFRLNLEFSSAGMTDFSNVIYHRSSGRILGEVLIAKRIGIFAGPSVNYIGYPDGKEELVRNRYIWNERKGEHYNGLYWGITGGVHISI